jgi:hypothetical protein
MTALTRWGLAHKKAAVAPWVILAIAGIMAADPGSDALESEYSVPPAWRWPRVRAPTPRSSRPGSVPGSCSTPR